MSSNNSKKSISQRVLNLANTVYNVENQAEIWKIRVKLLGETLDGNIDIGRPVNRQDKKEAWDEAEREKKELLAAIDNAVTAIPGVDQYVRDLAETKPGKWTTELKSNLTAFHSAIQTEGSSLTCDAACNKWKSFMDYFHESQRFLRNIDTSVFDEAEKANLDNADARNAESPAEANTKKEKPAKEKYTDWPKNSYLVFNPKSNRISITYDGRGPEDLCLSSGKNLHGILVWLCNENDTNSLTEDKMRQFCYQGLTIAQTVNKINQQINQKLNKIFGVDTNTRHELIYHDKNAKEIRLRLKVREPE